MCTSKRVRFIAAVSGSLMLLVPAAGAASGLLSGPTQMSANQEYCCG